MFSSKHPIIDKNEKNRRARIWKAVELFVSQPANYNDLKLLEYSIQYSICSIQFGYRQFLQYSCSLNWNQMARGESGLKTDS